MADGATSLLARALDSQAEPPSDLTSQRILDAALEVAAASGIRHLTMEQVARRAGVGRVTVYRRFGDKQRLVEALAVREARYCLTVLDSATEPDQPLADQVAEGFVASLRLLREHPLLSRLVRFEPDLLLEAMRNDRAAIFALSREYLAGRLRAAQAAGTAAEKDVDVDQTAEVFVRLMVSFALIGDTVLPIDDEDEARETARRLLTPLLAA
jgi:AcrR family transcriptional regulator